jgi:hypothetical protein
MASKITDAGPLSHQGEAQARRRVTLWATDTDVAQRAATEPDGVVACRERGRHEIPATRFSVAGALPFTDVTEEGFYLRRIPCPSCRHVNDDGTPGPPRVVREEIWDIKHRKGVILVNGAQLVSAKLIYVDADYLAPRDAGRSKPRQWRAAAMSPFLAGQNIKDLRREIIDARDERERLARETYRASVASAAREEAQLRAVPDTA